MENFNYQKFLEAIRKSIEDKRFLETTIKSGRVPTKEELYSRGIKLVKI